ncbi:MAG TPA: hypothetical protein ENK14_10520 [Caldithrix sp.]|nr:hypothetical protein [Caldithrix sp.]
MGTVAIVIGWIVAVFIGTIGAVIIWLILTGKINLEHLISEPGGDASLSRFQFLIFTFVISMSLFLIVAHDLNFPNIPPEIIGLLGISGGSYVISKGIQKSTEKSEKEAGKKPMGK